MTDLVEVRLLRVALDVYQRTTEHHDELLREFALMHSRQPSEGHAAPARLVALVETLTNDYGGMTALPQADIDEAIARGDPTVDLTYNLPPAIGPACAQLVELLREADDYCRHGDLLTMATPAEAVAFREWFLLEFVKQAEGQPPTPWPEYVAASR